MEGKMLWLMAASLIHLGVKVEDGVVVGEGVGVEIEVGVGVGVEVGVVVGVGVGIIYDLNGLNLWICKGPITLLDIRRF